MKVEKENVQITLTDYELQAFPSAQEADLLEADALPGVGFTSPPHETDPNSELEPLPETKTVSEANAGTPLEYHTPMMKKIPPVIGASGKDDEPQKLSDKLTLSEAAKQYGYKPHTLLQAIQRGSLPGTMEKIKVEIDAWFIKRDDLEAYIENVKKKGKGPGTH